MIKTYLYNLVTGDHSGIISGVIKMFLSFLAWIYALVVRGMIFFYSLNPRRLPVKVISVGNITLGGTGKTSLVEYVALFLKKEGRKAAILSRGYKKAGAGGLVSESHSYEQMGDEAYMLTKKLEDIPVIVDKDRVRGALKASRYYGADTVILDDGFQQWRVHKDLEIVTIDSTKPFGNERVIPRGILREPISSLERADIFVLTKTDLAENVSVLRDFLRRLNGSAFIAESRHSPVGFYTIDAPHRLLREDEFRGASVVVVSGIGDPASFERLVENLGMDIRKSFRFTDHHRYTHRDVESIKEELSRNKIDIVITTEKDGVRFLSLCDKFPFTLAVLKIALTFGDDEQGFCDRLRGVFFS